MNYDALKNLNRFTRAFWNIHVQDNSTPQSIPNGATYTKITAYNEEGDCFNVTCDVTNNYLILPIQGFYIACFSMNSSAGTNNLTWKTAVFLNEDEQHQVHTHRKLASAGDAGSATGFGVINVTASNSTVSVRVRRDGIAPANLTPIYSSLSVIRI